MNWRAALTAAVGLCWALLLPLPAGAGVPERGVTLVLAGGGAKGFAHLAVLRRLERDHVPIAKIIGTSIGAVIGSLYASGMSTQDIERIIASMDPSRVALDQLDRTALPNLLREYDRRHPVDLELGVRDGQLSFARGVSDGQQLLLLLQRLLPQAPPGNDFDHLPIPFRAVVTRYRDGQQVVLRQGSLPLAVRASMAAPGVFAPVEIDGETYVDGGLVANLPVEVALNEGAGTIVASYLGNASPPDAHPEGDNALTVTKRMLEILIRQNERRNIALLRPQDILVAPDLRGFSFESFGAQADINRRAEAAIQASEQAFAALAARSGGSAPPATAAAAVAAPDAADPILHSVRVTGNESVPQDYIVQSLADLVGRPLDGEVLNQRIAQLYASGYFERLSYQRDSEDRATLVVEVHEKPYGPNFIKSDLGLYTEAGGSNWFTAGLGLRRPWLTPQGLEWQLDANVGSQAGVTTRLLQPLAKRWTLSGYGTYTSTALPLYRPDIATAQVMANATLVEAEAGFGLYRDLTATAGASIGLVTRQSTITIDSPRNVAFNSGGAAPISYQLNDGAWQFSGVQARLSADTLDSTGFPTQGYYLLLDAAQSFDGSNQYARYRTNLLWATSHGRHVLHLGADLGVDHSLDCSGCTQASRLAPLYLGGFQAMGAYHLGQLSGDRLAHAQATYMYLLSDGGILHQPTYVGVVAEAGDAWMHSATMQTKHSLTGFIALDSKLGEMYLGAASGSDGNQNIFLQLGRRFSLW